MEYQIIADESVDYRVILELRKSGLSVYAIAERQPSIKDEEVLAISASHNALLITKDKDFGELVFRLKMPHCGVLLIRIEDKITKVRIATKVILKNYAELLNYFSVINDDKLRIKE